jgi:hypothetical protein
MYASRRAQERLSRLNAKQRTVVADVLRCLRDTWRMQEAADALASWDAGDFFHPVIFQALLAGQPDVAAQLLTRLDDPKSASLLELELAMATRNSDGVLGLLEQVARAVIVQQTAPDPADVIVRRSPALGILVARGALATNSLWEGDSKVGTTCRRAPSIPSGFPRFRASAEAAFESVPRDVAAIAMRTIGALAASDAAAWRKVKQAKDMPRQVIIACVGIHHRLLLRTDEGPLEVLDLVTRQDEDVALKRLGS